MTMTDAERMAREDAKTPYFRGRPQVSADAKYIVRAMIWIWVVLPVVAVIILLLVR